MRTSALVLLLAATLAPRQSTAPPTAPAGAQAWFEDLRSRFAPLTPPSSKKVLRFQESSAGLPAAGSWRNSLDVADFDEDGRPDLVVPPERGAIDGSPHVFLQNRDGSWREWSEATWPRPVNYGSAAAADLNRDGHQDVVIGSHLQGTRVFFGNGKGTFVESAAGLGESVPTRRVLVADVDADSWPDLVTLTEGPGASLAADQAPTGARLRVYRNEARGTRWKLVDVSGPLTVAGDWLAAGDFNADGRPDFVSSNIYFDAPRILFASHGALRWEALGERVVTRYSYAFAVAAGRFVRGVRRDDAIVSYGRAWPASAAPAEVSPPAATSVVGIDRIAWRGDGPVNVPIERFEGDKPIWSLGTGDFDRDGREDLVYARVDPRELVFLLGDGRGGFRRARCEGVTLPPNPSYDIRVADVDGDRAPDLVMMFERATKEGSIRVYLNRGARR